MVSQFQRLFQKVKSVHSRALLTVPEKADFLTWRCCVATTKPAHFSIELTTLSTQFLFSPLSKRSRTRDKTNGSFSANPFLCPADCQVRGRLTLAPTSFPCIPGCLLLFHDCKLEIFNAVMQRSVPPNIQALLHTIACIRAGRTASHGLYDFISQDRQLRGAWTRSN